ncbi:hypothetical protein [Xanthomonas euvesicatoria]|uniref:hypothetical protein n=1 Tax=Xanthomonas euvesicatoria TaxID=456327 RepID=UPI001C46BFE4|nr:hypothetical protein [Xanthomonas euvesicatoria]MBV6778681.1 hypothetical protein [Xanthomonas campestris pv. carissae]
MYSNIVSRFTSLITPLPHALRGLPGYAGATLIGDGRMALILDADGLRSSDHCSLESGIGNRESSDDPGCLI